MNCSLKLLITALLFLGFKLESIKTEESNVTFFNDDTYSWDEEEEIDERFLGISFGKWADKTMRKFEKLAEYSSVIEETFVIETLNKMKPLTKWFHGITWRKAMGNPIMCQLCSKLFVPIMKSAVKFNIGKNVVSAVAVPVCTRLSKYDKITCQGLLDQNFDILFFIFKNKPHLDSSSVCATLMQKMNCNNKEEKPWNLNVASGKSPPKPVNETNTETFKIIQITDIHYDPTYEPGSNFECGQPICCSSHNGPTQNSQKRAGFWGNYEPCDMPGHSVENLLKQIKTHNADLIYFTGDVISHRVWNTSSTENTASLEWMYKLFDEHLKNVPFYPILGNHEPSPLNTFAPLEIDESAPVFGSKWLFELVAELWTKKWLPKETEATIKKGGYYTVLHKPGFRIVALNSNVCYTLNWWLLYDERDPYDQLQWLADTLERAEQAKELVHILSHIPPGDPECLKEWGKQYRRIVNRYSNTIGAQFNGHTHWDELRLFYDLDDPEKVINVAYNGGSFTTFDYMDPNYRVYEIYDDNKEVIEFDEYVFNIEVANKNGPNVEPIWYKLYSFREAYNLKGITTSLLQDLQQLPERMVYDHGLLRNYRNFKYRNSQTILAEECNEKCMQDLLCEIVIAEYGDNTQCKRLMELWSIKSSKK